MRRLGRIQMVAALALVGLAAVIVTMQLASNSERGVEGSATNVADQADAMPEGIEVHGDWTIDVLEPDGRLVRHVEFRNALVLEGRSLIPILSRNATMGVWTIVLENIGDSLNRACGIAPDSRSCVIVETVNEGYDQPYFFHTLTAEAILVSGEKHLALIGTAIAQRDGAIDTVSSRVSTCFSGTETDTTKCATDVSTSLQRVTSTVIRDSDGQVAPVAVLLGQQVLVKVEISFS